MEHIRNARQQVENQIKHLTNGQYSTNLLGESLEDLAKKCTAKTLPAPDPQANEAFLEAVRSSSAEEDSNASRELVSVLRRRLAMENSHKQWLAIHLVSDLMRESPQSLTSSGREEVLACVADLTRHPSTKTNNPNGEAASESMRKTKLAALDLLRTTGGMGQQALRHAAGIGGAADMQRALQHAQHQHQVPISLPPLECHSCCSVNAAPFEGAWNSRYAACRSQWLPAVFALSELGLVGGVCCWASSRRAAAEMRPLGRFLRATQTRVSALSKGTWSSYRSSFWVMALATSSRTSSMI
mmetsp:Transcript_6935/g.19582  ORF Transcript_6935/g.19582 Transcript_6935/m.19582 type:complete len:299 (+) Transcript_6935:201-1097(+)